MTPGALTAVGLLALQQGSIDARFFCEPKEVLVGEPFALVLELFHSPEEEIFELLEGDRGLDDTWCVVDRSAEPPRIDPQSSERRLSRAVLRVASLEPGVRDLAPVLSSSLGDPRVRRIDCGEAVVDVQSVLAEGEDAPRPLRGLPQGFGQQEAAGTARWRWILAASAALVLGLLVALGLRRRRKRRRASAQARDPLELLTELEHRPAVEAGTLRERHFELSALVRRTIDQRLARDLAGLTDEEWLSELRAVFPPAVAADLEALFARAEQVKYGGAVPSPWATAEAFERARRALQALPVAGSTPAKERAA